MRPKLRKDWKKGEKAGKGYHPNQWNYYICDSCGRSGISRKEGGKMIPCRNCGSPVVSGTVCQVCGHQN